MTADDRIRIVSATALDLDERARHEGLMRLALPQAGRNPKRLLGAVIVKLTCGTVAGGQGPRGEPRCCTCEDVAGALPLA